MGYFSGHKLLYVNILAVIFLCLAKFPLALYCRRNLVEQIFIFYQSYENKDLSKITCYKVFQVCKFFSLIFLMHSFIKYLRHGAKYIGTCTKVHLSTWSSVLVLVLKYLLNVTIVLVLILKYQVIMQL